MSGAPFVHSGPFSFGPIVENERAVRAYENAGFEKVRVIPAHETVDDEKRDSWLMEKRSRRASPVVRRVASCSGATRRGSARTR